MGFAEVRLDRLPLNETVTRVLGLRPMPPNFKEQGGVAVVTEEGAASPKVTKLQRGRSSNGLPSPAMARRYVRDYQTQQSSPGMGTRREARGLGDSEFTRVGGALHPRRALCRLCAHRARARPCARRARARPCAGLLPPLVPDLHPCR